MNYSITKNGKPLDKKLYTIDEKTKTFSSNESGLVLDFSNEYGWVFDTGSSCTFKTGPDCTFKTSFYCTFKTSSDCTFDTGSNCIFKTGSDCTFDTGPDCTFDTGPDCTFNTSYYCTFDTGSNCIFKTGSDCTFDTGPDCTFNTGSDCTFNTSYKCVVVRRDIYEVIELEEGKKIKLNGYSIKGYKVLVKKTTKEMTVAEVSEKLGYDIKIIK